MRFRGILVIAGIVFAFAILFSGGFLANAKQDSGVSSRLGPLSALPNPVSSIFVLAGAIVIFAVLILVAFRRTIKKHFKKIAIAALVIVAAVTGISAVWSTEASIQYWLMAAQTYPATGDNALTINAENTGHLSGTFDLQIQFTKANISPKTSLPYQLLDNQTAKFTFTIQPDTQQSHQVWFTIDANATDFYISLSFQQNGANFFVKQGPGGVDFVSYQKDADDSNFTLRRFVPPP